MTDPYSGPTAAVTAWGATVAPQGTTAGVDGPEGAAAGAAAEDGVGRYDPLRGALVATFSAAGYARYLDWLSVNCSYAGRIDVYAGSIDELGRITSYGDGSLSEFDPNSPRYIPQGAALFVVWTVPDATHTASAKAGMRAV